ncbi:hypothetical protein Tco_0810980 [Tanacetum coccineum]
MLCSVKQADKVYMQDTRVPNADSSTDAEPLEQVHYDTDHNVFANDLQHFEQSESISNTCAVETGMDKSKIARKQSKTGKHGHENQKSTKPKPSPKP